MFINMLLICGVKTGQCHFNFFKYNSKVMLFMSPFTVQVKNTQIGPIFNTGTMDIT